MRLTSFAHQLAKQMLGTFILNKLHFIKFPNFFLDVTASPRKSQKYFFLIKNKLIEYNGGSISISLKSKLHLL